MTVRLLDVNLLVSLLDSAHVHNPIATKWFEAVAAVEGWASCPITEMGFIRVVSHVSYPNLRVTPSMAAESLNSFKKAFSDVHQFWPDSVSLSDHKLFRLSVLTGARQTTDTYLAGLAFDKGARFATLDGGIPWQAVRGAGADLVEKIIGC
jgi:toxin-antitoxin system PIN domain toxin